MAQDLEVRGGMRGAGGWISAAIVCRADQAEKRR